MAFTAEDILGEFAEAQGYGERQGLGKHDRQREGYREATKLDHPQRRAHMKKRAVRRKREWAEAKATRFSWKPSPPELPPESATPTPFPSTWAEATHSERREQARHTASRSLQSWLGPDYRAPAVPLRTKA